MTLTEFVNTHPLFALVLAIVILIVIDNAIVNVCKAVAVIFRHKP